MRLSANDVDRINRRFHDSLNVLVRWFREITRDPVEESFALRKKKLEADGLMIAFRSARLKGDVTEMERIKKEHDRVCDEWGEMADSYEKRFLSPNV